MGELQLIFERDGSAYCMINVWSPSCLANADYPVYEVCDDMRAVALGDLMTHLIGRDVGGGRVEVYIPLINR